MPRTKQTQFVDIVEHLSAKETNSFLGVGEDQNRTERRENIGPTLDLLSQECDSE